MPRPPSPLPPRLHRLPEHLPEDLMEAFAMGKPLGNKAGYVRTHLRDCDYCRRRMAEEVWFTDAIREALRDFKA